MEALELSYERNVAIRVPDGIMDTKFSHMELQQFTLTVVVPNGDTYWRLQAISYLKRYSGNSDDPAFKFHCILKIIPIHAIMHEPTKRLD